MIADSNSTQSDGVNASESTRGRVLVVDDAPEILHATARILERGGYTVFEASTGTGALACAADTDPHLALLDIRLPDIDGLEVCRRMKLNPSLADIFVVHCSSANVLDEAVSASVDAGADGYIARPVGERELLARVRAFFRHKETIDRLRAVERLQAAEFEREMGAIQQLSDNGLPVTSCLLGLKPLRECAPEVFDHLVRTYGDLLDAALEERIFRTDTRVSPALRALADRLFALSAGPRDVVELHYVAFKKRTGGEPPSRAHGFLEAGRMMLLELMGGLASAYRRHYVAVRIGAKSATGTESHG